MDFGSKKKGKDKKKAKEETPEASDEPADESARLRALSGFETLWWHRAELPGKSREAVISLGSSQVSTIDYYA